ncbi:MAG: hypothetical protein NTV80_02455 [Verrucomicrobia bacterium]|nr:hypothetical protein [Verrucomicrobiota bacterium]
MKTSIITLLLSIAVSSLSWASAPAIKVIEHTSRGESKNVGSVSAGDDVTRAEILNLWKDAKKAFPTDRRNLFGSDSGYVEITITNGDDAVVMRSWHTLFENNPKVVVTSHGVESLEGRVKDEVLKADEEWYREARRVFDGIVKFTQSKAEQNGGEQPAARPESK